MDLEQVWRRVVRWYNENTPRGLPLPTGAVAGRFVALEELLGQRLPNDFRESYLLHDGTGEEFLAHFGCLMPLDGIENTWRRLGEMQEYYGFGTEGLDPECRGPIKPYHWGPARIPITDNGSADHFFLDLDPAGGGNRGQVIEYDHVTGPERVLACGFAHWLQTIADDLEGGRYIYVEGSKMVAPPGMYH
jgi:cell wall assembly regulator SMI1